MARVIDYHLPNNWAWTTLGNIAEWGSGGTPKSTVKEYYGGNIPWLVIGDLNDGYISASENTITELGLQNSSAKIVEPDSVLVAMYGSIGKLGINRLPVSTNQAIAFTKRLYPGVTNKYLFNYLLHIRSKLHSLGKGGTQKNISQTVLKDVDFPLPPLAEQHRIVDKIEELFSDLDDGIASLKKAQQQLKVYRQAVLKWAFEGKLTAQWRKEQQRQGKLESAETLLEQIKAERERRYQEALAQWQADVKAWEANGKVGKKPGKPSKLKELHLPDQEQLDDFHRLLKGWVYCEIEAFLSLHKKGITTGPFGTMLKKSDHRKMGIPVLGIENIGDGIYKSGNKIFVTPEKAVELKSFEVEGGDIIISRSGTVGEICSVPNGIGKALLSTNLIRVSLNNSIINSRYFVYLFQGGGFVREQVKELCKGSTRNFLNQTILKSLRFPLPSLSEQNQIVEEIESRLSICDSLEAAIAENLERAEALRQSILKRAFEGKLVPQDPNDEPASVLLERIRAAKSPPGRG
ncbi:restriction endonuclease subunit S [Leptodesmis sichuanensis]|uniref:restriction endonuclease subunit S n=1 Tax=Leptodesmis sichuanensis TaxID=2906798 RepID=UPI001F2B15B6|nr:restriction endonuclease subunit S [Leptodesmis sichuanensis]UIE37250.1 restriction endonuclease subunit S [Leptodesmis sichuanensis A121]